MELEMRRYAGEDDYWRIREFLREVFILNGRRELSWQAYRFDYWRWHGIENMGHGTLENDVFIWETADGEMAAVLNREAPGSVHLQVHPDRRVLGLDAEMITVAEKHLAIETAGGGRTLRIWVNQDDDARKNTLIHWGYTRGDMPEYQRRRDMSMPIPEVKIPRGYRVCPLGDIDEHPQRSYASWKAFHPKEPDENYEGHEWYSNIQRAPLYRRDLDIVAITQKGQVAAFCTVWFDDVTRTGAFEPVGTAPKYQKRGLGKAVMCEALRRLRRLGATLAYVGSYTPGAHALYASAGFTDYDIAEPWVKKT
jgi:GNAT superfamily N-acetyltransferase